MRAHNERLVLSLVRRDGALAKSDIARITGLSAQTVSVIMRSLEADGLLLRGEPVRGRIGQPSVPMSLAADGAFFFGLKIGRRSVDLVLVNLLGEPVGFRRRTYRYPTPEAVVRFVEEALPALRSALPFGLRARIGGLGIAMPFQLWNWTQYIDAPPGALDAWRDRDIAAELSALCDMPVTVQNDATAACGAELVFGTGERPQDFLYFYIGFFIGGGLVLNGRLFTGRTGNAAGVGPMPVPGPDGRVRRLMTVASLSTLADMLDAAGERSDYIWESPGPWMMSEAVLARWIETCGRRAGERHAERGDAGRDRHGDDRRLDACGSCGRGLSRRRGRRSGGWTCPASRRPSSARVRSARRRANWAGRRSRWRSGSSWTRRRC